MDQPGPRPPSGLDTTSDPVAFAHAVEEMPGGVIVYSGPQHVVIGANRAARAFLDHRPGIIGRPIAEVFPESRGQRLITVLDRVLSTGKPFKAVGWRIAVDWSTGLDERVVNFDVVPVRATDSAVTGALCQFLDVTDDTRRHDALERDALERDALERDALERDALNRDALNHDRDALSERFQDARELVMSLQRILLPGQLPVLPGFRLAARYLVPSSEQAAGGDWFDAIPMGGRVFAVVGDVVGHGAPASAVMGQLRALLTEFLLDGDDLSVALGRLDRFASRTPGARGATVCVALLDPVDGAVRYACAGHPAPLVVRADGTTRFLPAPVGGPLGVAGPGPEIRHSVLAPDDLLVAFSDGLVERSGQHTSQGLDQLAEVAAAAARQPIPPATPTDRADQVAQLTIELMTRDGFSDDVTVLVVRRTGQVAERFHADLPAEPGQLAALRARLETWLAGLGAGEDDVVAVQIGVLEAVTNAVEHAYDSPGGRVQVEGSIDGNGWASLTVIDQGRWRPAQADPGKRGRGLLMVRGCMDSVEIETTAQGTSILLDRQLRRTPVLDLPMPVAVRPDTGDSGGLTVHLTRSAEPRIELGGPIDVKTVAALRARLWSASRGGALPLTVDLTGVTHLASAGVQLLFDFIEEMSTDGRKVRFVAPGRCPARYTMSISGLDQVAYTSEV